LARIRAPQSRRVADPVVYAANYWSASTFALTDRRRCARSVTTTTWRSSRHITRQEGRAVGHPAPGGGAGPGIGAGLAAAATHVTATLGPQRERIGIQTSAGGDVVGDHTVFFLGNGVASDHPPGEPAAPSRSARARGAVGGRLPARLYDMRNVLGLGF
jgi:hypothetical protein